MSVSQAQSRIGTSWCTIPAVVGLGIVIATSSAGECRADRIALRGGGQIRGKVLPDPQHPDRVTILTETGKTPLTFKKTQILQVQAEPGPLDEYLTRRATLTSTPEDQYALGLWCEQHALKDLAEVHFSAAVEQDTRYAPAHQKLGHVLMGDRWIWGDELREAQGLVRYKGRWISKEEKDQRVAEEAESAEQASWARRLKLLRQSVLSGTDERRRDAETQLLEIRDPVAVGPLVRVFGGANEASRTLLDHVLEQIPGPEAAAALVMHVLNEVDFDVRLVTIETLAKRKETNVVPGLVQGLGSKNPSIVNRAAWALGRLDAITTVPKLIPALITTLYRLELPALGSTSGGGGIGSRFGSVAPSSGLGGGYVGNGGSYGLLTPPVVGPGVAAFGATAVPTPGLPGASLSVGGGGPGLRSNQEPRIVPLTFQNVEVLNTLVKLTGQNFGFDIPLWQRWVSSGFHPDPTPVRRVPQP